MSDLPTDDEAIVWLSLDEVLHLHAIAARFGRYEGKGVHSEDRLQSALGAAQNRYSYVGGDLYEIAASYLFYLVEGHPFHNANKRTATLVALVFLAKNKVDLEPGVDFEETVVEVACKQKGIEDLAEALRTAPHVHG